MINHCLGSWLVLMHRLGGLYVLRLGFIANVALLIFLDYS